MHSKLPFFQKLIPCPHIFSQLKSFLWKGPLTVKVKKIWGSISFCFEIHAHLGYLISQTPEIIKSALSGLRQFMATESDEKSFLFHLKSFFCSQNISVFVLNFWKLQKGLIKKIRARLISNFLTSQPG